MSPRPYVLISAAASLDGYLDDSSESRLLLSNDADFDRVDEVRAGVDAILVGANTVRRDDPRLLVRSACRRRGRGEAGLPTSPAKVTLTGSGKLDPAARFFTAGEAERLVYVASPALAAVRERLGSLATVVDGGVPLDVHGMLADLARRGVRRLLVEGGAAVQASLLAARVVDELQVVYAPLFVGSAGGARLAGSGELGPGGHGPMTLTEVRRIGEHVLLRYLLGDRTDDTL